MSKYKKSDEMRRRILSATVQVVLSTGYLNLSIKEIANQLGVPRSLIYYYFSNKDDIMQELYQLRYRELDTLASQVLPDNVDSLVRVMFKYIIFRRQMVHNPLFSDYILYHQPYAAMSNAEVIETQAEYYSDTYRAFQQYGLPTDGSKYQFHVLMIESVAQALRQGEASGQLRWTEWESIEHFAEHTVMVTFDLTKDQLKPILKQAFELADLVM
mgnify:CR=1 FL=1